MRSPPPPPARAGVRRAPGTASSPAKSTTPAPRAARGERGRASCPGTLLRPTQQTVHRDVDQRGELPIEVNRVDPALDHGVLPDPPHDYRSHDDADRVLDVDRPELAVRDPALQNAREERAHPGHDHVEEEPRR